MILHSTFFLQKKIKSAARGKGLVFFEKNIPPMLCLVNYDITSKDVPGKKIKNPGD
jgi:hypothetical protein